MLRHCVRTSRRHFSTDFITTSFQDLHVMSQVPWYVLIPGATFTLRLFFTLPLAIQNRLRLVKQSELRPLVQAMGPVMRLKLAEKTNKLQSQGKEGLTYEQITMIAAKERRKRQKELFKEHGVPMWKNILLPAVQIPLWISVSLGLRQLTGFWNASKETMAEALLSGELNAVGNRPLDMSLCYEGTPLWFNDLTLSDPLGVMPVALGLLAMTNVEWMAKTMELNRGFRGTSGPSATDGLMNMSRFGVIFLMAMSTQAPVAMLLYWITSQGFSLVQNIFLDLFLPVSYTPQGRFMRRRVKSVEGMQKL